MIFALLGLIALILLGWFLERRAMHAAFDRERSLWMAERSALLTRIQMWSPPNEPKVPGVEMARPQKLQETRAEKMVRLGLKLDPDSGLPQDGVTGVIWESVEAFDEHLSMLAARKLPRDTVPDGIFH